MKLHDAVQQHKDIPSTFWVPDSDTKALKIGDLMKVACNGERFWVQVKKVEGVGEYIGRVDNCLFQEELNYGMLIPVSHNHIYEVITVAEMKASTASRKR